MLKAESEDKEILGVSICCGFYPNKCNDVEIIPFLSHEDNLYWNGKHLSAGFYNNCRELAVYNEDSYCYIFSDVDKLFKFAGKIETPSNMSDYITENYQENWIFIIWVR